jgi:hypothetical protein
LFYGYYFHTCCGITIGKREFVLWVLFPYMLWNYNWEKDTTDGFKSIGSLKMESGRIG